MATFIRKDLPIIMRKLRGCWRGDERIKSKEIFPPED
jgi:hypothetical protein